MGMLRDRDWTAGFAADGLPRAYRREGRYRAFEPDRLVGREFSFGAGVAADIADAERAAARFDLSASALSNTEALARILLRAESVASSRIEGLEISPQRLLRADAARAEGEVPTDATAAEVLANVDAMMYAVESDGPITLERLIEVHRKLLAPTRLAAHGGRIRTQQNWIGGNSYNPFGAAFVPPPHEVVPELLEDLMAFTNDDSLPATAQAAIAHAQFETIHPFVDGNGRTGRALVHMILRRRGLVTRTLLPVSLILATHADDYVAALTSTRFIGPPDSSEAQQSTDEWVGLFASACYRAVANATHFEARVRALVEAWVTRIGPVRADSSALALARALPATPIVTARSVQKILSVSFRTANAAIAVLEDAGVLTQTRVGKRNRAYEACDIVDAFTSLERQMASVEADTLSAPPVRVVPSRPRR